MTTGHRPPAAPDTDSGPHWLRRAEGKTLRTSDGVTIYYEVLPAARRDAPTLLLANGLGGRLYSWEPLVERFAGAWRIVTWDYRGLYQSGPCHSRRDLAIWKHTEDVRAILDAERIDEAVLVGWSMGVQIALDAASAYPDRVRGLVLLNGTHGHTLETAFQPLFRMPWLSRYLHGLIDHLGESDRVVDAIRRVALSRFNAPLLGSFYGRLRGNGRIVDVYRQYVSDIFGPSFKNFLRLFQALDAHSAYHHLPEIQAPALVVSGGLDALTPAYQSFEIARRLPRAEHLHIRLGTHFVLLEYPQAVTARIAGFLEALAR